MDDKILFDEICEAGIIFRVSDKAGNLGANPGGGVLKFGSGIGWYELDGVRKNGGG